ncbi:ribonuclease H-like domain-containing protein [Suillus ampliporus]|nr:ribonuclease H-like domain-containing protein [Suillus ampliporus]
MPIRWNTTLAEIDRAMKLKPAINQWVDQLDARLTGKKKRAAIRKKKKLYLSVSDWEFLERLSSILVLFYTSTLNLSRKHVPTICYTLPLYKQLELHMDTYCRQASEETDVHRLEDALVAGLTKLRIHMEKALVSDYPLLGAVLHPRMRVSYFEDESLWSNTNLTARVRILLDHMYQVYSEDSMDSSTIIPATTVDPVSPVKRSAFKSAVKMHMQKAGPTSASQKEVDIYLSGLYPCTTEQEDNPLIWWKVCIF